MQLTSGANTCELDVSMIGVLVLPCFVSQVTCPEGQLCIIHHVGELLLLEGVQPSEEVGLLLCAHRVRPANL